MTQYHAICLTGSMHVPAARRDAVIRALNEHTRRSRAEPGCLFFRVRLDPNRRDRLLVEEGFVNKAAFHAHQARLARTTWALVTRGLARDYVLFPCRRRRVR